ncbi:MAG TPA: hypothetical protein VHV79_09185 [Mycobacteriales bacterium]|jgi:hypothetical protein|nr:hypothetical protein [Mycobacteriales bacterium]
MLLDTDFYLDASVEEGVISQMIRPAAVIPEQAARAVLMALSVNDARVGGLWEAEPTSWRRFNQGWDGAGTPGSAELLGSIHIAYGIPTRYEITIFRATVTKSGTSAGWTVTGLCDEALQYGRLSLDTCPRADLKPPPRPFRFQFQ